MAKKNPSADSEDSPKKGGVLKLVLGAVLLLGVGAGGAYGAFAAGLFGTEADAGPDEPKLVLKGAEDPFEFLAPGEKDDGSAPIYGDGGSEYRTAYYSFEDSFTSNLSDSPGLIQVEIAVSTRRDGRVLQWVHNHELAIRSAILVELAATPEADVYSAEGKKRLTERLTEAINAVLEENEGFGGVDAVHFKGFLVQ